ncbi:MAG: glycosyltransferase family 2 protein, partial [Clostridia bacterium]|nr:glycosyltransferase family 2 protein [Clostridia bacterium]
MILSICMIVKDEEATLARCLDCVKNLADELIIVDTGSVDKSVEIARRYTDKVYFFDWCDDFAAARNFSFSMATGDYVMWLDADDVITDDNVEKLSELKQRDDFDVAFVKYAAAFDGDVPIMEYYRERVVRRALNLQWEGAVHEAIVPIGRVIYSDARIDHRKVKANPPMRNLRIFQKLIASGNLLDERQKFYYGRELFYSGMYLESIAVLNDFLKGDGWVENKIEACRTICR